MRRYKIITDSGCDISVENERLLAIDIMPFEVSLGNENFRERIDIKSTDFLYKIRASADIPKTVQITSFRFEEKFEACVKEGYDDVIVVLINGEGSATFNNAVMAHKKLIEEGRTGKTKFHLFDSHTYSLGYGYPIVEAAKKLEAGQSMDLVLAYLEDWFASCELYLIAFNLRHMKKSGRIKAASAVLGELMNIKPLIRMINGESEVIIKSRGERRAISDAVNIISKRAVPKTPFVITRSLIPEYEDEFIDAYSEETGSELAMNEQVGCVVSANAGTEFIGIFIKGQRREYPKK